MKRVRVVPERVDAGEMGKEGGRGVHRGRRGSASVPFFDSRFGRPLPRGRAITPAPPPCRALPTRAGSRAAAASAFFVSFARVFTARLTPAQSLRPFTQAAYEPGAAPHPFGNPATLNSNHWRARGPHNAPVSGRRVAIGVGLIVGTSTVIFALLGMGRDQPRSLSKEWRAAQLRRAQESGLHQITQHKVGAPVKVLEPSIVDENQ